MPDSAVTLRRSVKKRTPTLRQVIAGSPSTAGRRPAGLVVNSGAGATATFAMGGQTFKRASRVAFRISIVITSSSFGVRFEN